MATPVASNNAAPISNADRGAGHQSVTAPPPMSGGGGSGNPVPVASVLQGGTVGTAYAETATAQGGTSPYTFAVTAGALPTGLSMTSGGVISGTPTAIGSFSFTVTATDANGNTGSQAFVIETAAPVVATASNWGWVA